MRATVALERPSAVLIGVQGKDADAPHKGGLEEALAAPKTVAEVANDHEFGIGVPERSWLRAYVDAAQEEIRRDLSQAMAKVVAGEWDTERALEIVGMKHVAKIQERIRNGIEPPNSPVTIARKGSSVPLIDTGQFRSAITHLIEGATSRPLAGGGVTL